MSKFCQTKFGWVHDWFLSLEPWKQEFGAVNRSCWVIVHGVPLHAWCQEFFSLVAMFVGTFISLAEETENWRRLDYAKIQIMTSFKNPINQSLAVSIAGQSYDVSILESLPCCGLNNGIASPPDAELPLIPVLPEHQPTRSVYDRELREPPGPILQGQGCWATSSVPSAHGPNKPITLFNHFDPLVDYSDSESPRPISPQVCLAPTHGHDISQCGSSIRSMTDSSKTYSSSSPCFSQADTEAQEQALAFAIQQKRVAVRKKPRGAAISDDTSSDNSFSKEDHNHPSSEVHVESEAAIVTSSPSKQEALKTINVGNALGWDISEDSNIIHQLTVAMIEKEVQNWSLSHLNVSEHWCRRIWSPPSFDFITGESDGLSGGLLFMWDADSFICSRRFSSVRWLIVEGSLSGSAEVLSICCIYAPVDLDDRLLLWDELISLKTSFPSPWLIVGDFNQTLLPSERKNGTVHAGGASAFRRFMQTLNLEEFFLEDRRFTWSNSRSASKIDRVMAEPEWNLLLPTLSLKSDARGKSDHWPLILSQEQMDWGFKPFRFQDCWWEFPGFMEVISGMWEKVEELDLQAKGRDLTAEERVELASFCTSLHQKPKQACMLWWQKSRLKWSKLGDRNTRFFHITACHKGRKKGIHSVIVKAEASKFFASLYDEPYECRPKVGALPFNSIPLKVAEGLERPITLEEVKGAVWACDSSKAPGPDGYNFAFYKRCWPLIHRDLFALV
ncbi:hypothetical protein Tsubulata_017084 [Turnera subulata]|uniref:DUF4283 domain-containing protein n=1 Tax=Turnera subulata TaxID=218843 RepID=A0A9Q0JMF3_9ROSI|nr:hypothetical protein Tsubulata_017084 [Turnera subulata]